MAQFENEGYCPANEITQKSPTAISRLWRRTSEVLGDRIEFMVYSKAGNSPQGCYVVDVLQNSETIGLELACALRHFVPDCACLETDSVGRKITCTDVINPEQFPVKFTTWGDCYVLAPNEDFSKNLLIEDERYLVCIHDAAKDGVHISIYKKPPAIENAE